MKNSSQSSRNFIATVPKYSIFKGLEHVPDNGGPVLSGIGADLIKVARIEAMLKKWGDRFTHRLFTQNEIDYCNRKSNAAECFAARFAAKEALAKALGHGWCEHFSWTDVEVRNLESGRPIFQVTGKTERLIRDKRIFLSISHTEEHAIATVVAEAA